jgi:hypothetical protein
MTAPDTKAIRAMADALEAETGRILLPGARSVEAEAMRTLCDALDTAQTENERLREALALLTVRAGSLVFAHHHGNGLEGWHKVIEGVDCALTQARSALSSTGEKG